MTMSDIDRRLSELNGEFQELFKTSRGDGGYMKHAGECKRIADEMAVLKEKKAALLEQQNSDSEVNRKIQDAIKILSSGSAKITEWDESIIRQLVDTV